MHADIPKQFLNINGNPVLFYTIRCFDSFQNGIPILVVLPEPYIDYWKSLTRKYNFQIHHQVTMGGETRFHSVKSGLEFIDEPGIVAIHDGVRPLVSKETLSRVFLRAEQDGNAVPAITVSETLRLVKQDGSEPINRENYRMIQTPQCFHSDLLKRAYQQGYKDSFTDDATVVETLGLKINLVEGDRENIKITHPRDLKFAEALLK